MKLYLVDHNFRYAVEQMLLTLFPDERPEYPTTPQGEEDDYVKIALLVGDTQARATCRMRRGGKISGGGAFVPVSSFTDSLVKNSKLSQIVKLAFYRAALDGGHPKPVWGALTGVRPGKLMEKLLREGKSIPEALKVFREEYDVSPARTGLCLKTAEATLKAAETLGEKDVCLYIGIPFCPTRCDYCSFVSQSVEKSMALIEPFFEALLKELHAEAEAIRAAGLHVVSIYMGGGTPTTLSAEQLDTLFTQIETELDCSGLREITVEAGRPDTITLEKLQVLRKHNVSRISVNPQTMSDRVLQCIGRNHTAEDIRNALAMVRQAGGFTVNMDLIAGLPGDDVETFQKTIDQVLSLAPENVTVHTLSKKRGSSLSENEAPLPDAAAVGEMLDYAMKQLPDFGYEPYYLYRQKFMSGGFENVGWTKPGSESLYNICIMEELCSILAIGGGASTKLVAPGGVIKRSFCPKYPKEYIEKIDELCERKQEIVDWYREEES